jgi:hypothetical protein
MRPCLPSLPKPQERFGPLLYRWRGREKMGCVDCMTSLSHEVGEKGPIARLRDGK